MWIVHPCVGVGDKDQKPFWFRREPKLGDLEAQILRLPSASCGECAGTRGDELLATPCARQERSTG